MLQELSEQEEIRRTKLNELKKLATKYRSTQLAETKEI
jgi:hypothetical protein